VKLPGQKNAVRPRGNFVLKEKVKTTPLSKKIVTKEKIHLLLQEKKFRF